jgi:hypothetical protein
MARAGRLVKVGLATVVLAALGWIITVFAVPFLRQPDTTEDLTAAWTQAGPTPLGKTSAVTVPPGQTLVAFLVGTDLYGIAGTTTGTCTANGDDRVVDLGWPVQINPSLTDVLEGSQQTVAIAGWTNDTGGPARVDIRCTTGDSTVDHFVAVPTRTAVVTRDPWFQPWGWVAIAAVGVALVVVGLLQINPPSR